MQYLKDQFPCSNSEYATAQHWVDVGNDSGGVTLSCIDAPEVMFGDLRVEITAEQASWNPDVVDDMISRLSRLWRESLQAMVETGTWEEVLDVDEDE